MTKERATALVALLRYRAAEVRRLEVLGVTGLELHRRKNELGELQEQLAQSI